MKLGIITDVGNGKQQIVIIEVGGPLTSWSTNVDVLERGKSCELIWPKYCFGLHLRTKISPNNNSKSYKNASKYTK